MKKVLKFLAIVALVTVTIGCKTTAPIEYSKSQPLIEPETGRAVLYLFRAPHDVIEVHVTIDGMVLTSLPSETYTVVHLNPGKHILGVLENAQSSQPKTFLVDVAEGERRFAYLSGAVRSRSTEISVAGAVAGPVGAAVAVLRPTRADAESYQWKECSELDAHGFISISKFVKPQP